MSAITGPHDEERLEQPLLADEHKQDGDDGLVVATEHGPEARIRLGDMFKEAAQQGQLAWPLVLNLVSVYALSIINLAFAGHLGKLQLAAVALGTTLVGITSKIVLMGLCGGLDTQASQAFGAGNLAELGAVLQRTVAFLLVHCIPLSLLAAGGAPLLLRSTGSDPELADLASTFILALVPSIWLDAVARPLNGILVAQRITRPQMVVSIAILPLHVATNYVLVHSLGLGYLGVAAAVSASNAYFVLLTAVYIQWAGLGWRVWGSPSRKMWQGWGMFARLAYPACVMRCAESWAFSILTVLSGLLPDPETNVAALSVAFNIYGMLYMGFAAFGMTACTSVGNALGRGDGTKAKIAALSAGCVAPLLWLVVSVPLAEPHMQRAIMLVFTDGTDPQLLLHLRNLLYIVVVLELLDGLQTIMSGVIQGSGKQRYGALVNLGSFYLVAIPLALYLAFVRHLGVEGMYAGMTTGPLLQATCYMTIVLRTDWRKDAARAAARASQRAGARAAEAAKEAEENGTAVASNGNA